MCLDVTSLLIQAANLVSLIQSHPPCSEPDSQRLILCLGHRTRPSTLVRRIRLCYSVLPSYSGACPLSSKLRHHALDNTTFFGFHRQLTGNTSTLLAVQLVKALAISPAAFPGSAPPNLDWSTNATSSSAATTLSQVAYPPFARARRRRSRQFAPPRKHIGRWHAIPSTHKR